MANKDKLVESAQKFLAKGQLPKAIGEYQKLVEAFPKDFRNRQKLAELLSREKRNDEAQPHYEAVANNFTETGFYLKAIAIYKQMQKIEPNRVDIYLRLAELNEKQGLIGNALGEYRSLIAFYDKNRMTRESVGILKKMIALEPENLGARGKLIETLVATDEQAEALDQFHSLVRLLSDKGEQVKIVKLYEKFFDLCPEEVAYRLPLADALLKSGQAEKALPLLKSLLKQAPDHPDLLPILIDCHSALGNHDDARLTCQHLLKDHAQNLDLRERYIRICLAGSDFERALESLEDSKEAFSQADRIGVLRELYETLQPALPDNARLQSTLAAIYEATGEAGARPVFTTTSAVAGIDEETADAAIFDAASSDVEQLDLVGEEVVPVAVAPPPAAPAREEKSAKPKGGFELELDLDLEPEIQAENKPTPVVKAAIEPAPAVAPVELPSAAVGTEMELELDLGGFDDLEIEPESPAAETEIENESGPAPLEIEAPEPETAIVPEVAPPADTERDLELEFDLGGLADLTFETSAVEPEPVAEPELVAKPSIIETVAQHATEEVCLEEMPALEFEIETEPGLETLALDEEHVEPVVELPVEPSSMGKEPSQPDFDGFEFEVETSTESIETVAEESSTDTSGNTVAEAEIFIPPAEETVPAAVAEPDLESVEELEPFEELEEIEELATVEEFEDAGELETVEEVEPLEELEELEEMEELEEVENLEESENEETPVFVADALSAQRLRDEVEEAEFFLRQSLLDDAERVVLSLLSRHGDLPELSGMLAEITAQRQVAAATGKTDDTAVFADFMAELKDDELLGATDFLDDAIAEPVDEFSLEGSGEEAEDAQSHFDLGIAYKEMGLFDDAISEFSKAARDPARHLDCLMLKGQCQIDMGNAAAAEDTYRQGLQLMTLSEEGRIVLLYELGLLYEALNRPVEALENYQMVADRDLFYRDVTDKLKQLRGQLGIDDQAIEDVSEKDNRRDRISYV